MTGSTTDQRQTAQGSEFGQNARPIPRPPFPDLMCSPVGLMPKKDSDEMRMIMHLNFPYGACINNFIDPDKAATQYQHFDDTIKLVIQQSRFRWLAKGNVQ